ncbi:MAG: hypothetical protein AB3X44_02860 [Leptothrix sp. (in: b-proteobacteria)]
MPMSPLLAAALEEARSLSAGRAWTAPIEPALAEAERLLQLVATPWPQPELRVEPSGAIVLEWDAGERGWVELTVDGSGQLSHGAVIDGDEYGQAEDFADRLPDWAAEVLRRLYARLQ